MRATSTSSCAGASTRPIPFSMVPGVTRWVQDPIARVTMGVRTYGKSPTGVREWYRADDVPACADARPRSVDGVDLGPLAPRIDPPVRFGFSEPPRRPSMVWLRPLLEYRVGRRAPGVKRNSRRLFDTTNRLDSAIAAPAIIGLSSPLAANGIATVL